MPPLAQHPILQASFAIIDQELRDQELRDQELRDQELRDQAPGQSSLSAEEYAILRRMIHSTADFDLRHWLRVSPGAIAAGIAALQRQVPIIVDVGMVRQGCQGMVARTFQNPLVAAVDGVAVGAPGRTRTETGLLQAWQQFPGAIVVVGNAPTALQALCDRLQADPDGPQPALVIGAPVGFVGVEAAKAALAETEVPQIRVDGRKGGSPVAAAILNALLVMAWEALP